MVDPAAQIQRLVSEGIGGLPATPYPRQLPAELAPWLCYLRDQGYCLLVVPSGLLRKGGPSWARDVGKENLLTPVPVKTVLRLGWGFTADGFPISPVTYDPELGVLAEEGDEEF